MNNGRTHWDDCWQEPNHFDCALGKLNAVYAEALTDGGWQVQIVLINDCERSDWFEAATVGEAVRAALTQYEVANGRG